MQHENSDSRVLALRSLHLPKVVLSDCRNCEHLADFTSDTFELDTNVRSTLNDLICVIGELWRRGISVKLDV